MKISKYVKFFNYDDSNSILYNSINGAVLKIENKYIKENMLDITTCSPEEIDMLKNLDIFISDSESIKKLENSFSSTQTALVITVELTKECNLNCSYCYQHNSEKYNKISKETMDLIIRYIDNCTNINKFDIVRVDFIGGEPLLAKNELIYIYTKVLEICKNKGIKFKPGLDTNGVLLTSDFLKHFHYLNMSITLTSPEDHNKNRPFKNNSPSYDTIIKSLIKCKQEINNDNISLSIRYNTNEFNYHLFEEFLINLSNLDIKISTVNPMYTDEYDYNNFTNGLSKQEFIIWNSTTAIDLLIKYNFRISFYPQTKLRACKAYQKFNCKVFANGFIGLCDSFENLNNTITINDIANNPDYLNIYFKNIKNWTPLEDNQCLNCSDLVLCGGKYFCKKNPCQFYRYDLENYFRKYIYYSEKCVGDLFPNTQ